MDVPSHLDNFPIPVRIFSPFPNDEDGDNTRKYPILLFFHGGGFVIGSGITYASIFRKLSKEAGVVAITVDYRLAPEYPFPTPLEDCYSVLRWISGEGRTMLESSMFDADASRVIVLGDSAGANLAATVSHLARDRKETENELQGLEIIQQILLYPCVIPIFQKSDPLTESMRKHKDGYVIDQDIMIWFWNQYIPSRQVNDSAYINPLLGERRGLPPAIILTAELDVLSDEGKMYHEYLLAGGVPSKLQHYDSTVHGFWAIEFLPEAQDVFCSIVQHLRSLNRKSVRSL